MTTFTVIYFLPKKEREGEEVREDEQEEEAEREEERRG